MRKGIYSFLLCACVVVLINGCATVSESSRQDKAVEPEGGDSAQHAPEQKQEEQRASMPPDGKPVDAKLPEIKEKISPELLYQIMLSEIARQQGNIDMSLDGYLDAIRKTTDYRLAWRTTQIALRARHNVAALTAAQRWLELNPDDKEAHRVVAVLHASLGNNQEAIDQFEQMVSRFGDGSGEIFNEIAGLLVRDATNPVVLSVVQGLAERFPTIPLAHLLVADISLRSGDFDGAFEAVEKAMQSGAQERRSLILKYRILWASGKRDEAIEGYAGLIEKMPEDLELRQMYARFLLAQGEKELAIEQFEALHKLGPDNLQAVFSNAMTLLENEELNGAEKFLRKLLESDYERDEVLFFLGRIAQVKKQYDQAVEWFMQVAAGERLMESKMRVGGLYIDQGKYDEGMRWFEQVRQEHPEEISRAYLVESEFLRENKEYQRAFDLLTRAITESENDIDLLYARAMISERLSRIDLLESDLRKVISLDDSHAHALNALGYTLADLTDRHDEALALIEKAFELKPDDAAIIDSLGWVNYRLGNLDKAEEYLRQAYAGRDDPEIAAHLGEVLWVRGMQEEALEIWRKSLEENPDNESLKRMFEKFKTK